MSDNRKQTVINYAGHIVQLLVYLLTFAYFVGGHSKSLEDHAKALENLTIEVKEMKKDIAIINGSGGVFTKKLEEAINSHEIRLQQNEKVITKIEVIENDLAWFKKWLMEKSLK